MNKIDINQVELIGTLLNEPIKANRFNNEQYYTLYLSVDRNYKNYKICDCIRIKYKSNNPNLKKGKKYHVKGFLVLTRIDGKVSVSVSSDDVREIDKSTQDVNQLELTGKIVSMRSASANALGKRYIRFIVENRSKENEMRRITVRFIGLNKTTQYIENNLAEGMRIKVDAMLEADRILYSTDKFGYKVHHLLGKINYINRL